MKALSLTTGAVERDWIETTARAAVRFAAGKATAGFVAPPVASLASSMLAAMLFDSIKVLALLTIATLAAAGVALAASQRVRGRTPSCRSVESGTVLAISQVRPEPAPKDAIPKALSDPNASTRNRPPSRVRSARQVSKNRSRHDKRYSEKPASGHSSRPDSFSSAIFPTIRENRPPAKTWKPRSAWAANCSNESGCEMIPEATAVTGLARSSTRSRASPATTWADPAVLARSDRNIEIATASRTAS